MTTFTDPFTNQTISPSQVGYEPLTISANTTLQWPVNGNTGAVAANIMQVIATTAGLTLAMPSALQVSNGQTSLIQNVGANAFTVVDYSGNTIVSIASGVAQYVFITDNTTTNGTWSTVTFGAGTSSANAAALAGNGLIAQNTTLSQSYPESAINSSAVLTATNRAQFLVWSAGAGSIALPSAAVVGNGWFVNVRNGGSGILTVTASGTDTIDDNANKQLQLTESMVIVSNGSNGYYTFAYGRSSVFQYTQLSKGVTGGTTTLSAVEYANVVQQYSGTLTSNQIIVLPSTVQVYYLNNTTSGSFSLTFKTAAVGGATVVLPQNQTLTVVCDGTNVFNAGSAAASAITSVTVSPGSAGAPTITFVGDTSTGIFSPASGVVGFSSGGISYMTISSAGLFVTSGIAGGTF